jgi:hypothetical protein
VNDKNKIMDKVRKCLALSKSSNEHEAAAALRQAQKLMAMHDLTEEDVGLVEYVSAQVITDYEWPVASRVRNLARVAAGKKSRPMVVPFAVATITHVIRHAFGVEAVYEGQSKASGWFFAVRYFGPRARVVVAEHAHVVVSRAVRRAWKAYLVENPWVKGRSGARAGFYYGWCNGVIEKVAALVPTDDEKAKIALFQSRTYKDVSQAGANKQKVSGSALAAGESAAEGFEINRPVGETRRRIGHGS